jgi:hypothetical protein
MIQPFVPMNELESILVQAKNGQVPVGDLMKTLLNSDVVLPSGSEVLADGTGFEPLLFSKEEVQMVACFTDKSRIGEYVKMTLYCLIMKGKDFFRGIPNGHGVVVNPGQEVGFDIPPDGVSKVLSDFSK